MLSAAFFMDHPHNSSEEFALEKFRKAHVDLDPKETRTGRAIQKLIISQLEAMSGYNGFPLVLINESFVAGSFGRKTLCQPLDDIDIYLVLNAGGAVVHADLTVYRLEGTTQGPLVTEPAMRDGIWISADRVLERVANRLSSLLLPKGLAPSYGLNSKRKSAFIKLDALNLNIDITPVLWAKFQNAIDRFYMPKGRSSPLWKPTNPREDQRRLSIQNQSHREMLLPTIRLLKWWNQNMNQERLKGIHLEVMVENALRGWWLEGIAQAIHLVFASLPSQLEKNCEDPTLLGPSLDGNLSTAGRADSIIAAQTAYAHISLAAKYLACGDWHNGIIEWKHVFPYLK